MPIATKLLFIFALVLCQGAMPSAVTPEGELTAALRALARPLRDAGDLTPLVDAAAGARLVLLGESSHGTRGFYRWRAILSRRLIHEQAIAFIAIEGDWSSLLPLDRYVRHRPGAPATAREALLAIHRWPRWVWANEELAALGEWLRAFNRDLPPARRVGIHGIDLYAIWESLDAVQAFYRAHLPALSPWVERLYRPLRRHRGDYHGYADRVRDLGGDGAGPARIVADLAMRYRAAPAAARGPLFEALQHAAVVSSGERYLARREPHAWNTRSAHFAQTLSRLLAHYGPGSRGIVWAHNTHIGDARATDMQHTGEVNLGQLARQRYGRARVFAVGFGTGTGTVSAARRWEGERRTLPVPLPRPDSIEAALMAGGGADRILLLRSGSPVSSVLNRFWPHRAIGVVFDPRREPWKNYVPTRLAQRYDAFVFLPLTRALTPLGE